MNKDHIVILKKIPVDPQHVGSLRLHKDAGVHAVHHQERMHHSPEHASSQTPRAYRIFSTLLFCAFLINPIGVAYAEEVAVIPDAPPEQSSETPSEAPVETPPPGVTIVVPPSQNEEGGGVVAGEETPPTPPAEEGAPTEETPPSEDENVPPVDEGTEATSTATSTEPILPEDESGTSSATTTDDVLDGEGGGETDDTTGTSTETSIDETASSTAEITQERVEDAPTNLDREQTPEERAAEREVAEAAMREQIKKEVEAEMRARCVSYGGDGYYCLDENSENQVTDQAPVEQVISAREGGGDKEIILVRSLPEGESRIPLTINDIDDEFPSADGEMRMIVWQSLIDGRWQIAYKEEGGVVEYLTATQDGNGHPATDGKRIVWQGWSGGNWDIFLAEPGSAEASFSMSSSSVSSGIHPAWKATKISASASHDMFPKIAGNFVTWQEHRGEEWVIVVYDLSTGQTRTVKGEAGGTGEAPTVALIFKERTREGRILIRASDLATGERIPLREDELPEPAKLPIPEQSGALPLQSGTSSVTSIRAEGDGDGGTPEV